ncbi:hypothetical protein P5673_014472 [Acropora cervicornis]|uniref:Uncharacterized protein n=1 Tax=Acropora cervicornis TaxID=6130 RepID=A0AAD9QK20_ACRCE|nr:hypothetical protein P5673_014472 [Acropora cervicornis]
MVPASPKREKTAERELEETENLKEELEKEKASVQKMREEYTKRLADLRHREEQANSAANIGKGPPTLPAVDSSTVCQSLCQSTPQQPLEDEKASEPITPELLLSYGIPHHLVGETMQAIQQIDKHHLLALKLLQLLQLLGNFGKQQLDGICLELLKHSCTLANKELIQSSLNEVTHEYFNWTTSVDVPDQDDCDDDSCSSDSDSACLESDAFSEHQDNWLDLTENDGDELKTIRNFLKAGCGCQLGPKAHHCSSTTSYSEVLECHTNCLQLSKEELDLIVLSHLQCHLCRKELAGNATPISAHITSYMGSHYVFMAAKVGCQKACALLRNISEVSKFISNYAEEHALVLPGRVPGFKRTDVRLLPSQMSKASVWRVYSTAMEAQSKWPVGYSKSVDLWNQLIPHIVIMRPMSDLWFTCQHNNSQIVRSANLPESLKSACVRAQEEHLARENGERSFYKSTIKALKPTVQQVLEANHGVVPRNNPSCSLQGRMNYSYDYAQQVHYPSNPLQPGPIYFKTLRKCSIFGVCCEAILRQVNFLVEEAVLTGVNVSQLCWLHDGSVLVPTYDWASFLDKYFKKLPGVKGYHHFRSIKNSPGRVFCKRYVDSEEVEFDLLKDPTKLPPCTLPPIINPAGLDLERRSYLYKEIRQFCKPKFCGSGGAKTMKR